MSEKAQKPLIKTPKDLEKLILLMKKHKVDCLEIEGKKIIISRHDSPVPSDQKKSLEYDEELEWWNMGPQ